MAVSVHELTKSVRRYDRELFAGLSIDGVTCVYRKTKRYEPVCELDGRPLFTLVTGKEFVCALTDTWTRKGKPRAWGTDFVLNKLREMDLQANERFMEEFERREERLNESKKRSQKTENEGVASYYRRAIAKATDDVLVRHRWRDEPTKRKKDRSFKNGNS